MWLTKLLHPCRPSRALLCSLERAHLTRTGLRASLSSSASNQSPESRGDMEELFLDKRVRYLLKSLTGYDPLKVFQRKSIDNLSSPKYQFMTDEQLQMEKEMSDSKADQMLQMPPVKYAKSVEPEVLEEDVALQGFLDPSVKLVFLDATAGFADNERLIVIRESNGTLREATREERHRTNQIFYPVEERNIDMPKMFEEPALTAMFERGAYKLLLDNACLHLEPEDSQYIELCHKAYEHIALTGQFDQLWSTRHFGGMVYYYAFYRKADPLLHHLAISERFNDAYNFLRLYYIINPRHEVPTQVIEQFDQALLTEQSITKLVKSADQVPLDQFINILKIYITHDSTSSIKHQLQLVLQKLQEPSQEQNASVQN